jgi:hypothetical protein
MSIVPGTSVITEYDPNLDPNGRTLTYNPMTPVEYGRTVSGGIDDDSVTADGSIKSVAISAVGSGYKAGDVALAGAQSTTSATFTFTVDGSGKLTGVVVKTNGVGYVDDEEIAVTATSGGAGGSGGKIKVQTNL